MDRRGYTENPLDFEPAYQDLSDWIENLNNDTYYYDSSDFLLCYGNVEPETQQALLAAAAHHRERGNEAQYLAICGEFVSDLLDSADNYRRQL